MLLCYYFRLKENFILLSADGPDRNILKFKPPMCFSKEDVDRMITAIDEVLTEVEACEVTAVEVIKEAERKANGAGKHRSENGTESSAKKRKTVST